MMCIYKYLETIGKTICENFWQKKKKNHNGSPFPNFFFKTMKDELKKFLIDEYVKNIQVRNYAENKMVSIIVFKSQQDNLPFRQTI